MYRETQWSDEIMSMSVYHFERKKEKLLRLLKKDKLSERDTLILAGSLKEDHILGEITIGRLCGFTEENYKQKIQEGLKYAVYQKDRRLSEYIYSFMSERALQVAEEYNLTRTQTNLYNFICRGDFKLRNGDGDMFFNPESNGIGSSHSREWVQKELSPLINAGLVKLDKVHDCRDARYTSWYFYDARFAVENLVCSNSFVAVSTIHEIKDYLNLPDGWFDGSPSKKYGDFGWAVGQYGQTIFHYKGEEISRGTIEEAIYKISKAVSKK